MSNRSGTCSSGFVSQDKMLKVLMEKNLEIRALKAEIDRLKGKDLLCKTSEKY